MDAGLFGGTFNPLHNGHIGIVKYVQKRFNLQKIYLIPSALPPHKPGINLASAKDRFDMVNESLKNEDGLFVSDIEIKREGPSFTIDTIKEFKVNYGFKTNFCLLMGSDAFLDITTWEKKNQIFKTIPIIVMLRGDWKNYSPIISFIDENISKGYKFNELSKYFSHEYKKKIYICKVPKIDISSTKIRNNIKNNESITDLVPSHVEEIILKKELYR
jgi:nicotinate-nucleotide adenylyltransferase